MSFNEEMAARQTQWRKTHIACQERGKQGGKSYPWILPRHLWEESLWPGIRSGSANSLPEYLQQTQVQKHLNVHNLKSSWVLCANEWGYFLPNPTTGGREKLTALINYREQHAPGVGIVLFEKQDSDTT